jgi:cyclopropane fatty-acyl-phospholipid synthase-like methyltransferase
MYLESIDFAAMYRDQKAATHFKGKSRTDWDDKSASMAVSTKHSPYVDAFISRMALTAEDTVLDIGCGPGSLAIPLAKRAKRVVAVDFSRGMLDALEAYAAEEDITNIETHLLGWEDSWAALPEVDIAIASRSVEVGDIETALHKMSEQARKACYLTYKAGGSFVDMEILDYIGKQIIAKPDFWYIPLLLYRHGYLPRVDYIQTERGSIRAESAEAFVESLIWSVHHLDAAQQARAREYYERYIIGAAQTPRPFTWAFIGWETQTS